MPTPPDLAAKAAANITAIILEQIKESIAAGELPADIKIEGFQIYESLIVVELSNNTNMEIELSQPH